MTHEEMITSPEVRRTVRSISEEKWVSDFLMSSDRTMRRIGSAMVLQEMQVRLGLIEEPFHELKRGRPRKR